MGCKRKEKKGPERLQCDNAQICIFKHAKNVFPSATFLLIPEIGATFIEGSCGAERRIYTRPCRMILGALLGCIVSSSLLEEKHEKNRTEVKSVGQIILFYEKYLCPKCT